MKIKHCSNCGKEYAVKSNAQKKCDSCREVICGVCGKRFIPSHKKQRYCSQKCYLSLRFANNHKCKQCGKHSEYSFCSDRCRKDYWNKNGYKTHTKKRFWKQKTDILNKLGGKCIVCGENDFRLLDIDHIDKHKKKMFKNHQYTNTRRLKEWKENMDNLRLLCVKCHRLRTWEQQGYGL